MEAAEIIEYLRQRDLNVTLTDDDSLELSPAEKITHELIDRLRKHKSAIIQELKREQNQKIEIVRAWLFRINESETDHDLVLNKCRNDHQVLEYFMRHAHGEFE
jgi:hypothetical protein